MMKFTLICAKNGDLESFKKRILDKFENLFEKWCINFFE
jgi:hypothetical protein